jgi:hypothetical protein
LRLSNAWRKRWCGSPQRRHGSVSLCTVKGIEFRVLEGEVRPSFLGGPDVITRCVSHMWSLWENIRKKQLKGEGLWFVVSVHGQSALCFWARGEASIMVGGGGGPESRERQAAPGTRFISPGTH